jgi:hypothetical protein
VGEHPNGATVNVVLAADTFGVLRVNYQALKLFSCEGIEPESVSER